MVLVNIYGKHELSSMREAGKVVAACHAALVKFVQPGVTTLAIDAFVEDFLTRHGTIPAQKGYHGYPFASCTSVNDEICHGFPTTYCLREGDILTIDMVAIYQGMHADSAWSYAVGEISSEAQRLLAVTQQALFIGIAQAYAGQRLSDIGAAIQQYAEGEGCAVIREFTGHGVGRELHETPPEILHFALPAYPGQALRLKPGMAFTIEPMLSVGHYAVIHDDNKWTARTADGSLCAQYEHTIVLTDNGPEIVTVL